MSKIKELEKKLFNDYGYNEPILTRDINALEEYGIEQSLLLKYLSRLNEEDRIQKFDTGVYYFAEMNPYLNSYTVLGPDEVIEKKYITNKDEVFGYRTGYAFANPLGLTTQVPMVKRIVTEKISKKQRDAFSDRYVLLKSKVDINKTNVKFLQVLDLIAYYQPIIEKNFDETIDILMNYLKDCSLTEETIQEIFSSYPAKTVQTLLVSGYIDLINQVRKDFNYALVS